MDQNVDETGVEESVYRPPNFFFSFFDSKREEIEYHYHEESTIKLSNLALL